MSVVKYDAMISRRTLRQKRGGFSVHNEYFIALRFDLLAEQALLTSPYP